ncbi:MAG: hypothetical protein EB070_10285 [Synechococcaceae bacterium WBA_2_066]|nr:hypothetical protein [Synechococcaceae bacterium WB6_1B_055]NBR45464.1 hypothetical protein [Synechococcaceae bacterium WB5_2B_268]NCU77650.1 hypothetical protein [Synechococcaceae bacterium WB7_1C_051]NDC07674.1 hypothetical protein [Synechococcaceae bacterium WB9_2_069]NDE38903.1 hypothetical protein [Synechococcaceae bacterium WBA_2_066]
MTVPLTRRSLLTLLSGVGLLAACSGPKQRLGVQNGTLPRAWLQRLPAGWGFESITLGTSLPKPGQGLGPLALTDGWAASQPVNHWLPWPASAVTELLMPEAQVLLPWGLPVAMGPWLLVLRDRPDLWQSLADKAGWQLLLHPSLRGQLLLPASQKVVLDIAKRMGNQAEIMDQLKQQALGFNDVDALTLLLNGEAQAAVLPSRAVVPLLRSDSRLRAFLPIQGAPLWWNLLVRPASAAAIPPLEWLLAPSKSPLLDQLLRAGFTPPLKLPLLAAALSRQPQAQLLRPSAELLARCTTII